MYVVGVVGVVCSVQRVSTACKILNFVCMLMMTCSTCYDLIFVSDFIRT